MRQLRKLEMHEFHDQEKWVFEKLAVIDKLTNRVTTQQVPHQISEMEKLMIKQELEFVRENLLRLRYSTAP